MYTIYTQNMCGYCTMAKELLEDHSMEYKEIPIDADTEAKNYVKSFAKTVSSNIFVRNSTLADMRN